MVYVLVWALWLAAGGLSRDDEHVRAEVFTHLLGEPARRRLEVVHAAVGIAVCGAMAWGGVLVVEKSLVTGEHGESSLQIPLWIYYAGMPVGMGLMVAGYALRLVRALRGMPLPAPQETL